jgi:hypothetical protein
MHEIYFVDYGGRDQFAIAGKTHDRSVRICQLRRQSAVRRRPISHAHQLKSLETRGGKPSPVRAESDESERAGGELPG